MESLSNKHFASYVLRALRHAIIQLSARPGAEIFAEELRGLRAQLTTLEDEVDAATVARMILTKKVNRLDKQVGKLAVRLSRGILDDLDVERRDAAHRSVFPVAATEGTAGMATDAQAGFVTNAIAAARELDPSTDKIRQRTDELETQHNALLIAVVAHKTAKGKEAQVVNKRDLLLDQIKAIYNHLPVRLLTTFPGEKTWVEEVFI